MPDYANKLLNAINNYNADDPDSVNHLRDLVCWISDNAELKKDPFIAELLYTASQKMRVFGYNVLNQYFLNPNPETPALNEIGNQATKFLYRSLVNDNFILDKTQKEVLDLFQSLNPRRLLVSAPTSYGKTFLMREIVFLNKDKYHNILLVFPTVALLLENAREMAKFVNDNQLDYQIIKTADSVPDDDSKKIFVFTPERTLQLIAMCPDLKIDFFFFDEVYKIDEDYCTDDLDESEPPLTTKQFPYSHQDDFLDESRGKTFRIALYLLAKTVEDYYLAGPNLEKDRFGKGLQQFIKFNSIQVKEIIFEPTLRITVDAHTSKIKEKLPLYLPAPADHALAPAQRKKDARIEGLVSYIDEKQYGKTLLYCTTPAKVVAYSNALSSMRGDTDIFSAYPESFKSFISHIQQEYDVDHSSDEWSLIKVLKNGFGMHHGKLPKYIQQEILEQFNKGPLDIMFCTSTIVEGVNTDARNMIILNPSKGRNKLTPFDIKNIKGRAGRYYHCFVGRVFYTDKEIEKIENSDSLSLDFVTYSDKALSAIDLDNADVEDLTAVNSTRKIERDEKTKEYYLTQELFEKNRTISKENQEKLIRALMDDAIFSKYYPLLSHIVEVENFLKHQWIYKILDTYYSSGLIDEYTKNKFYAIAQKYYKGGFKELLKYEIELYKKNKLKSVDQAYSEAFKSLRDILEHKIPMLLSLFESVLLFVAEKKKCVADAFSLSKVRRYYETGVKSLLGEALIEYGFPIDAIRRIEENNSRIVDMDLLAAKNYCRTHYQTIKSLLDDYENQLFVRAMNSFK